MSLISNWKKHPTRRKELAELLNDPALFDAITITKAKAYEITFPPTGGNYSLQEFYALYGAKMMGYLECLQNFLGLAEINPHAMPDRKPWVSVAQQATEGQPEKPNPENS